MSPVDHASGLGVAASLRLIVSAARSTAKQRIRTTSPVFYLLVWLGFPVFSVLLVVLIYRGNDSLRDYAVVAGAGLALLFGMQFNAAEILDGERQRGTLGNLFISPAPRFVWLAGFQLYAVCESLLAAAVTVGVSVATFGLEVSINIVSLTLTTLLLLTCMWGFSMLIGAIGLALRDANQLSNLLFPIIQLLAGTMYPVALMPDWIRLPAECLPFGYALQAIADSVLHHASLADLTAELVPLAGFAAALPVVGVAAFRGVERRVRARGALELV